MSRGPGRLQRWLLDNLPDRDTGRAVTAAELGKAYYDTDELTANRRTNVLRSLQNLHQRGLVKRWPPDLHGRGQPIGWTRS